MNKVLFILDCSITGYFFAVKTIHEYSSKGHGTLNNCYPCGTDYYVIVVDGVSHQIPAEYVMEWDDAFETPDSTRPEDAAMAAKSDECYVPDGDYTAAYLKYYGIERDKDFSVPPEQDDAR